MSAGEFHQDGCTYDEQFVAHGYLVEGVQAGPACLDEKKRFSCWNCKRRICWCMGHGDCGLCDECCGLTRCGGDL